VGFAHARGHIYILNRPKNIDFVRILYVRSYYCCQIHKFCLENPKGRHYLGEAGVSEWDNIKMILKDIWERESLLLPPGYGARDPEPLSP